MLGGYLKCQTHAYVYKTETLTKDFLPFWLPRVETRCSIITTTRDINSKGGRLQLLKGILQLIYSKTYVK